MQRTHSLLNWKRCMWSLNASKVAFGTVENETLEETKSCALLHVWFHPTLTFSFQILQRSLAYTCTTCTTHHVISWTWDIGGNQVLPRFHKQDLVPSNSQIQPPKFWFWIPMLPKLSHHTNLILQWPMPTDRGAGDKMLEKTELLKLSVADKGRVQFPTTLTFRASS